MKSHPIRGELRGVFRSFSFFLVFSLCFIAACGFAGYRGKSIYASILAEMREDVNREGAESAGRNERALPTVILDPGHGGMDAGAVGIGGLQEKNLNLEISLRLKALLEAGGFEVLMTREEDVMLGDGEKGHAKLADLRYRLDLAKAHPDAILVSIHMNKFPAESCKGLTVYYGGLRKESESLGGVLREKVISLLQPDNEREMKKATSAIYLLHRLPIPGVLVECGFLSNPEDAAALQTEDHQKKLALVLAGGILDYANGAKEA